MLPRQNVTRQSVTRQNVTEPKRLNRQNDIVLVRRQFLNRAMWPQTWPITAARDRALRPKIKFHVIYERLAWEHSAAKVTKSNSRRLPALKRFYRESRPLNLKSQNQIENIPVGLPSSPIKI